MPGCDVGLWRRVSLGRELEWAGHEVKLIAPRYVKPFIKRQKNAAADAEAIVEAALRPTCAMSSRRMGNSRRDPSCSVPASSS
jgi:transposase